MKTLGGYSSNCVGNWAGRVSGKPDLSCCSWMDLHTDTDHDNPERKTWTIEVQAVSEQHEPVLVHKKNGVFVYDELKVGGVYSFNHKQLHGLVPKDIAKTMVGKKRRDRCREYLKWAKAVGIEQCPGNYEGEMILVWEFIDDNNLY